MLRPSFFIELLRYGNRIIDNAIGSIPINIWINNRTLRIFWRIFARSNVNIFFKVWICENVGETSNGSKCVSDLEILEIEDGLASCHYGLKISRALMLGLLETGSIPKFSSLRKWEKEVLRDRDVNRRDKIGRKFRGKISGVLVNWNNEMTT